jgi:hypothetical protein
MFLREEIGEGGVEGATLVFSDLLHTQKHACKASKNGDSSSHRQNVEMSLGILVIKKNSASNDTSLDPKGADR